MSILTSHTPFSVTEPHPGFWTERYLERKLAAYRAAAIENLILWVADDLARKETDLPAGAHITPQAAFVGDVVRRARP